MGIFDKCRICGKKKDNVVSATCLDCIEAGNRWIAQPGILFGRRLLRNNGSAGVCCIGTKVEDKEFNDMALYGLEYEISVRGRLYPIAEAFHNSGMSNIGVIVSDCSIRGVEINTIPMDIDGWQSVGFPAIKSFLTRLKASTQTSIGTTECGIHVHMNKLSLVPMDIIRMLSLLMSNRDTTTAISGRTKGSLSCWASIPHENYTNLIKDGSWVSNGAIKPHRNSIELRIFKGTTAYSAVFGIVELTHLMRLFVKETDITRCTWDNFIEL